ncbi:MAG: hypothetical protein H7123_05760, partial [Thermoleophilia bacterium]|nr:hypothetical protein [Thermoleophilia bacterium]
PDTTAHARADADPVHKSVKRERSRALRAQADAHARKLWASKVGTEDVVVVEMAGSRSGMTLTADAQTRSIVEVPEQLAGAEPVRTPGGYTRDYCPVWFSGDGTETLSSGDVVPVRIVGATDRGLDVILT